MDGLQFASEKSEAEVQAEADALAAKHAAQQAAQQAAGQKAEEEEAATKRAQEAAATEQADKDEIQKAKLDAAARLLIEDARQSLHKDEWAAEAKEAEAEKARQAERNHVAAEAAKKQMQDYKKAHQVLKAAAEELADEQHKEREKAQFQQTRQAYEHCSTDLSNTSELTMAGTDDSRTEAAKPKAAAKKRVTATGMGGLTGGTKSPFRGVVVPKLALPTSGTGGASPLPTLQTGDRVAGNKADFKGKCLYCQGPVDANDKRIKCSAGYCECHSCRVRCV